MKFGSNISEGLGLRICWLEINTWIVCVYTELKADKGDRAECQPKGTYLYFIQV